MESRMPGDPMSPTTEGTAEVHSRVTNTPTGSSYSGAAAEPTYTVTLEDQGTTGGARSSAQGLADQAKDRAQELGQKASDAASQAREKAGEALNQVQDRLEESGVLDKVRENALPVLGVAFGLGFLLAGSGDGGRRGKRGGMYKAKNQLKGAVMGGLSAAVAQEFHSVIGGSGGQGMGGLLSSLLGGSSGSSSGRQGSQSGTPHRPPSHKENL